MDAIQIPEGLEVDPESETYEGLATFTLGGDGTMTLTAIDGLEVGEPAESEETEKPEGVPSEEDTIGSFVKGQLAAQGM